MQLRRRRVNPNHMFNYLPKAGGLYCKYKISSGFQADNSPYLWILKPTFFNRVSINLFRAAASTSRAAASTPIRSRGGVLRPVSIDAM